MTPRNSFLKRCLALVMALVLLVSSSNLGFVLQASAATDETTSLGKLMASNYSLSDAEKALLESGYLYGDHTISYKIPEDRDGLVTVDTENKKITAESFDNNTWAPVSAQIVVGDEVKEEVALSNGAGSYTYSGNAFSVKVRYQMYIGPDVATQQAMLDAMGYLKKGIANTNAVSAQGGNLYILEEAMPELVKLANTGVQASFATFELSDECKAAIATLNGQMTANGGKLNLSLMVEKYDAGSKTNYLINKGAAMQSEVAVLYKNTQIISTAMNTIYDNIEWLISDGYVSEATANQIKTLAGVCGNLVDGLAAVNNDPWYAANNTVVNSGDATLDSLVAALGSASGATASNPLLVAETSIQANLNMKNVTVKVVLKVVADEADSAKLVEADSRSEVLTLSQGATPDEIKAEAGAVITAAEEAWAEYGMKHYEASTSTLPESLDEDIEYTITYAPKNYEVEYDFETDAPTYVPYGYQLTLPKHADPEQAYDYTVNGESMAQGDVYTVVGKTTVSREAGKAYATYDLYAVIADNFGNKMAEDILTSGALKDNTTISVREPDIEDAESLLSLTDNKLTAKETYPSDYKGLLWTPYSYGSDEENPENLFSGNTASWSSDSAKVKYILKLTNVETTEVAEILALAADLKAEAEAQIKTLDALAQYYDTMAQLDKTKLGALNGVIDVTDFTPDDKVDTDEKNLELRAYFKNIVGGIIANNLDSNNYLKIYNILGEYKTEGLRYYYTNSEAILSEIDSLSTYLSDMLGDEEKEKAVKIMVTAAGYPEYAEKIATLEAAMAKVKEDLTAPNSKIDLSSANLGKLINALTAEGSVETKAAATPYLLSKTLTVNDASQVIVQVNVKINGKDATYASDPIDRNTTLTQGVVDGLKAKINGFVEAQLGDNAGYYTVAVTDKDGNKIKSLDERVDDELTANVTLYYSYTAKIYTVAIEGCEAAKVTIENREITLPANENEGYVYIYTLDGEEKRVSNIPGLFTLTDAQMATLKAGGSLTISREEVNEAEEKLEGTFENLVNNATNGNSYEIVYDTDGNITGLIANIAGAKNALMSFAMDLVNSGYSYIGFNGEPFLYLNSENTLEISLQTLINAVLNDNTFGSQTLIDLGNNGKGKFIVTDMQVGDDAENIAYEELDFTLNMASVPAQMAKVAEGLSSIKPYMTFGSQDGVMVVNLNLPDKVYGAYLTALIATGNADLTKVEEVNSEIAFQFLYDYIEDILNTDANTTTFTNTLKMLGQERDLTGYETYYGYVKKALTNEGVSINAAKDERFEMNLTAKGKSILSLVEMIGFDLSSYETYIGMVKEFKTEDGAIYGDFEATLVNTAKDYQALVLDLNASGALNKFDYTTNLPARVDDIAGNAVIVLVGNVDGDLNISGSRVILDLNGYTVDGSITSAGSLYIVDSRMATATTGYVTGSVDATVITGGKYKADVSSALKDGYKQNADGVVQNNLYTIESDGTNVTFVIDSNVLDAGLPSVKAMAVDIAVDVAMNYVTAAGLTYDGSTIYDFNLDNLITLLNSSSKVDDLMTKVVNMVDADGINALANAIIADVLDFAAIEEALNKGTELASYGLTIQPWAVTVQHITDGDYLDFSVTSNDELAESCTISLKVVGDHTGAVADLCGELADVVTTKDVTVTMGQPTYTAEGNIVSVTGSANANIAVDLTASETYTNADYITVITGILGDDAMVEALNANDMDAVKDAFDALTVADVIAALKALNRNDSFAAVASKAGITVDTASAAELEEIYHLFLCAAGKALEVLEITGPSTKLGSFDTDDDGVYEYSMTLSNKDKEYTYKNMTAYGKIEKIAVSLSIKVFADVITEEVSGYLFVDLHPVYGSTLDEFKDNLEIDSLSGYSLEMTIDGNDGTGLVKNGDVLNIVAQNGNVIKNIQYTVIVLGDTNCNGTIEAADATVMRNIFYDMSDNGVIDNEAFTEVKVLAADANHDGTLAAADATRIRTKFHEINAAILDEGVDGTDPEKVWNDWYEEYGKFIVEEN